MLRPGAAAAQTEHRQRGDSRYVIVTPVRDEERYIIKTIESVLGQNLLPNEWIVVNDGSTDDTGNIVDHYSSQHSWIRGVHRPNRGFRKSGSGVMEAFHAGLDVLQTSDWQFLVKLDGDLSFGRDYFEQCLEEFKRRPQLGIGGGTLHHVVNGVKQIEEVPRFHVRGATKIYRRECWDDIGDLPDAAGWDTIDEVKANMLGWTTESFARIEVRHHRFTGTADRPWHAYTKIGRASHYSGYHPLYMAAKSLRAVWRRPHGLCSIAMMWGYLSGYARGLPRVNDEALIRFTQREQIKRLLMRDTIWK